MLDLGQRDHVAVLVADGRHVAYFGYRDQPPVGLADPGDAVEQVDVTGRRERADLEVLEPPHLQAAGDHRVESAELDVLLERRRIRAGRYVAFRFHPVRAQSAAVRTTERQHGHPRARMEGIRLTRRTDAGRSTVRSNEPISAASASMSIGLDAGSGG